MWTEDEILPPRDLPSLTDKSRDKIGVTDLHTTRVSLKSYCLG